MSFVIQLQGQTLTPRRQYITHIMCEGLIVRRNARSMFKWLTEELKYPLDEGMGRSMVTYKELCVFAPGGFRLTEFPLAINNNGGPKRYWCGPVKWGMRFRLDTEALTMIPDHSLTNMVYKSVYLSNRCLVPVTGFIYQPIGTPKTVYIHYADDRFFHLAAIFTKTTGVDETGFALANVMPNPKMMRAGCNNMPAILTVKEGYKWLKPGVKDWELDELMHPVDDPELVTEEVDLAQYSALCQPLETHP